MSLVSDYNDKINLAIAANESGDFASALKYAESALLLSAALPDTAGLTGVSMRLDRTSLISFIASVKQKSGATTGAGRIGRSKINYVNTTASEDDQC